MIRNVSESRQDKTRQDKPPQAKQVTAGLVRSGQVRSKDIDVSRTSQVRAGQVDRQGITNYLEQRKQDQVLKLPRWGFWTRQDKTRQVPQAEQVTTGQVRSFLFPMHKQ